MQSHEIDHHIIGDDMQLVEIELDPGETVIAEAGVMNYMDSGITFEAKMGDGSDPKAGFMESLFSAAKRTISGESIFITHFTNSDSAKRTIAFASPFPGKIIPIDLATHGGEILCQKDAFLCAALGTKLDIALTKRFGTGFFGGEGFVLQRLTGDGMTFIHACGTLIKKELKNETLIVDTGCLVGFTNGIEYAIQKTGNLKSMVFSGEGIFLTTLKGTGTVYLQSLPFSRLANRILAHAPSHGGSSVGEGSVLGAAGKLFQS